MDNTSGYIYTRTFETDIPPYTQNKISTDVRRNTYLYAYSPYIRIIQKRLYILNEKREMSHLYLTVLCIRKYTLTRSHMYRRIWSVFRPMCRCVRRPSLSIYTRMHVHSGTPVHTFYIYRYIWPLQYGYDGKAPQRKANHCVVNNVLWVMLSVHGLSGSRMSSPPVFPVTLSRS